MNRVAVYTGILSLTLIGVAAQAQTQSGGTQPGSQAKLYQNQPQESDTLPGITYSVTQPPATDSGSQPKLYQHQAQPGAQTPPGSTYSAMQQRSQNQPGSQPKLYQHQGQAAAPAASAPTLPAVAPPTPPTSASTVSSPRPLSADERTSTGFFTGWYQLDQGLLPPDFYQPKFYREQTTSQESHGPGITYPYDAAPTGYPAVNTYAATQPPQTQPGSQPKLVE